MTEKRSKIWIYLLFIFKLVSTSESHKIAVIGAGAAGLTSAKNALEKKNTV